MVASLIAAFMSTISTHLNWGSSYIVSDFYKRFVKPEASEKEQVGVGRISTVVLMFFSAWMALTILENATQAFDILLLSGAGTGAIYLLRWFWWRINAWTEIVAMISATAVAFILVFWVSDDSVATTLIDGSTMKLLIAVGVTTIVWIFTTFVTKPEPFDVLINFYKTTKPGGPGWKKVLEVAELKGEVIEEDGEKWDLPVSLLNVLFSTVGIYSALFSIGNLIYGNVLTGLALLALFGVMIVLIFKLWPKLRMN